MDTKNKKSTVFSEIADSDALIDYLQSSDRRDNIQYLHHYTSAETAVRIIKDSVWHLGKAENMNDKLEYDLGAKEMWDRLFFSSFMGEDKESIAMWSMYGQPWEKGVKISIPKSIANRWVNETTLAHEISLADKKPTGKTERFEKNAFRIAAVAYSNCHDIEDEKEELLRWSTATNKLMRISPTSTGSLTGYVKNKAWAYEKEFRIMLSQENCSKFKRVGITVPDYLIQSMQITPSPLFEGVFTEALQETVRHELTITKSLFYNKLNIRTPCSQCGYRKI